MKVSAKRGGTGTSPVRLLAERYRSLSPSHQRLADLILSGPHEAALMTLERMAEATNLSPATVNRLGTKIGLSGYRELNALLRDELKQALKPVEEFVETVRVSGLSPSAPWTQSIEEDIQRIQRIKAVVGRDGAFAKACGTMAAARNIYFVGFGSSAFLGQYAAFNLAMLRGGVYAIPDSSGIEGAQRMLLDAGEDDLIVQFAFARYSDQTLRLAEQVRRRGLPTIYITDSIKSPVRHDGSICFVIDRKRGFVVSGGGTAAVAVIEALLLGTAAAIGAETIEARGAKLTRSLGPAIVSSDNT